MGRNKLAGDVNCNPELGFVIDLTQFDGRGIGLHAPMLIVTKAHSCFPRREIVTLGRHCVTGNARAYTD